MRIAFVTLAALALAGCNKAETTAPANDLAADDNAMMANDMAGNAATAAAFSLNGTTWEYTSPEKKKLVQESIDADGNYVTWAGAEHVDHGKMVMKDGKACFTSAMTKEGESCWTVEDTAVGETKETVSDKGEKLMVKRLDYVAAPAM